MWWDRYFARCTGMMDTYKMMMMVRKLSRDVSVILIAIIMDFLYFDIEGRIVKIMASHQVSLLFHQVSGECPVQISPDDPEVKTTFTKGQCPR